MLTGLVDFVHRQYRSAADVDCTVTLTRAGVTLATRSGIATVTVASPAMNVTGLRGLDLCGDHTVSGRGRHRLHSSRKVATLAPSACRS
ncbi:MAG: hypothetical protein ACYDIE_05630 [Candidatus Krumholzibacteriia bacterium]